MKATRPRLVLAEAAKLLSVRTTWALLIGAATFAGLAAAATIAASDRAGVDLGSTLAVRRIMHTSGTGALLALVFGIVTAAGEYRHGTIIDTYLSTPRRAKVLVTKLFTTSVSGLFFGVATAGTTLLVASVWLGAKDRPLDMGDVNVWGTLVGSILWSAGYAAVGVALGTLLRNQFLAVVAGLTWILILEQITMNLVPRLGKWLPASSAAALGRMPEDGLLPQWAGGAMLAGYTVILAVAAVLTTMRRDVT